MATATLALPVPTATIKEVKVLYKDVPGLIAANDRHSAAAYVLVLLRLDGSKWLARMRKDGLFRASRYGFDGGCLKKIVEAALNVSVAVSLSSEQIQYLQSVQALLELARPARQIYRGVVDRLKTRKDAGLKTLLAIVNASFSADWTGDEGANENSPRSWSATDLASALSRLYMISRDDLGIGVRTWTWTDDSAASPYEGTYSSLLMDALRINELIDAEVMVDGLPYMAKATSAGVFVSAIDPEFERSIRLGYIQTDIQVQIRINQTRHYFGGNQPKLPSFKDTLSMLIEAKLLDWVVLKEEPQPRFVINLTNDPQLIKFLRLSVPFLEEFPYFEGAILDNFQPREVRDFQVSEHLSVMDVLKAQRLFNVIDILFNKKLKTVTDAVKRSTLRLRSTVMVTPRQDLEKMLQFVMSPEKAQEFISLLSLTAASSTAGAEPYIDLQYKPFVHSVASNTDYIAIPPAVVAKSNLVRSILYASGIKKATVASEDPMQKAVAAALREAGFLVRESFEFNIDGNRETDIFCYRDGVLVVIECKNAYHPCSPHEVRNSYDLILTAEAQLDIRAQWLTDPSNQLRLLKALEWNVSTPARVRTCVVTANRIFSGYRCGAHPVRQAYELINVLVDGHVGRGPEQPPYRFWGNETFEVTDLLNYLDGKSVVGTQHAAMSSHIRRITLKDRRLEFAQFKMDLTDHDRLLKESFAAPQEDSAMNNDAADLVPAGAP
jgi:hypothetical protein